MGKVTFYYLVHSGRRLFKGPGFRKAFRQADVIDIETGGRYGRDHMKDMRAAATGDSKAYDRLMADYRWYYGAYKDPESLYNMELLRLLFGSKKRIEFETKLRGRRSLYAEAYGAFPGLSRYATSAGRKVLAASAGEGLEKDLLEDYGELARFEKHGMARYVADSRRIAERLRRKPRQKRLVIRGFSHWPTTAFLRNRLKGVGVDIGSIHMPVRVSAVGTPAPAPQVLEMVRRGKPARPSDILHTALVTRLFEVYANRGWNAADALSQANFIVGRIRGQDMEHLAKYPRRIAGYVKKNEGRGIFTPWWLLGKGRLRKARGK